MSLKCDSAFSLTDRSLELIMGLRTQRRRKVSSRVLTPGDSFWSTELPRLIW